MKSFVLYVDLESDEFVSPIVGRCDREINCSYHYSPKAYFKDTNQAYKFSLISNSDTKLEITTSFHNEKDVVETLAFYKENNFIQFLKTKFEIQEIENMITEYKIGTVNYWNFGTVFWQVDSENRIRSGKIIIYNKSGKRTKYINWIHSLKIKSNEINSFNLKQCFFGEHLINNSNNTIAIVESEKTACIMSLLFKKYLWLAAGSLNGLNETKMEILKNRKIILYPDLGINGLNGSPFSIWKSKCEFFKNKGFDIEISDLLEIKGTSLDRDNGYDIADYFLVSLNIKPKLIASSQQKIIV